jgi:hypothetical protein
MTGVLLAFAPLLAYVPFVDPLPVWDYWPWQILPLALAIAVVYKSIKCHTVAQVPREAIVLTLWIVLSMVGVAAGVLLATKIFVEWT